MPTTKTRTWKKSVKKAWKPARKTRKARKPASRKAASRWSGKKTTARKARRTSTKARRTSTTRAKAARASWKGAKAWKLSTWTRSASRKAAYAKHGTFLRRGPPCYATRGAVLSWSTPPLRGGIERSLYTPTASACLRVSPSE